MKISVDVALYGSIARARGGKYVSKFQTELPVNASISDLLSRLCIHHNEKSFLFINSILCDMPGLNASLEEKLQDGDHVGIFSDGYMWPYQYRDGIRMSNSLKAALKTTGALHHAYKNKSK